MVFSEELVAGKLIKRYKRFLADVLLDNGEIVTAHCTNSGSMLSCIEEGAPVMLSRSKNPNRRTAFTWELIFMNNNWIGVNTLVPNKLAEEWINAHIIPDFPIYDTVKREVRFGDSRFDVYAENDTEKCFIEVKNVTYKWEKYAIFPDAKTTRGQKHLKTLLKAKQEGFRAVMLYIIQRSDVEIFAPAEQIDPEYAQILRNVHQNGVEIIPCRAKITPKAITFDKILDFRLSI